MGLLWYFAYGSNMHGDTLRGRRQIEWQRAVPVRAPGWRVVFDKPPLFPIGESFANLVADPGSEAVGVAFEVSEKDLSHIELTEGVLIGNYEPVTVPVESLQPMADGPTVARSLTSPKRDPTLRPSARYMGLLVAGALEHGLPEAYVATLRAVTTGPESALSSAVRPLLDAALRWMRRD